MQPIISVRNIGKKYKLGATLGGRNYKTLRDILTQAAFGPFRKLTAAFRKEPSTGGSNSSPNNPITQSPNNSITKPPNNSITKPPNNPKEFWALKDISFDVNQGEVVGIIGRNGAGKSTLLKILSEITEPTEGEIRIRGRVASLLEVGTGFHPELSGRENVYMNGAILGMTKAEIDAKFDEIVAFAEMEKFIDTPVKRYSSGMSVRLAFAVAAHLEPEILLVDEVLAVGDVGFQKKCIGKMENVATEGRTVLLVSHNMGIIGSLCQRALLIDKGEIILDGNTSEAISVYTTNKSDPTETEIDLQNHENRLPGMKSMLRRIRLCDTNGNSKTDFMQGEKIVLEVKYDSHLSSQPLAGSGFILYSMMGVRVGGFNTYMGAPPPHHLPSKGIIKFIIENPALTPGGYYITISLGTHQNILVDKIENAISFMVLSCDIYKTGYLLVAGDGVVALDCSSSVVELNS